MSKGNFKKIQSSGKCVHGPRALMLTGFSAGVQTRFKTLVETLGLSDVALIWATDDQSKTIIDDLVQLPDGSGSGESSSLRRAIIVGGITEHELQILISGCAKAGLKKVLWAALTPTSVTWPLGQLLSELAAEHAAMSGNK